MGSVHDDDTTASEEQLPPEDEVRRIAAAFDEYRSLSERWETAGSSTSRWGSARVCRVRPGRVLHVVGASEMAESLRDLLSRGEVVGWALQPMAETRTPLDHFLPQFRGDGDAERPGAQSTSTRTTWSGCPGPIYWPAKQPRHEYCAVRISGRSAAAAAPVGRSVDSSPWTVPATGTCC
jgi:hypothetical protein